MPINWETDLIVPQSVLDVIRTLSAQRSPFFSSGVAVLEEIDAFGRGGNFVKRKYSAEDSVHGTRITGDEQVPSRLGAHADVAPVLRRLRLRTFIDGEGAAEGGIMSEDPSGRILQQTISWWTRETDEVLLACLAGAFGTGGCLEATHLHDVTGSGPTPGKLTYSGVMDAAARLGDAAADLALVVMHSRQYLDVVKEAGARASSVPVGSEPFMTETFVGPYKVVVSDAVPVEGTAGAADAIYTAVLCGAGSFWSGVQQDLREFGGWNARVPRFELSQTKHFTAGISGLSASSAMPVNPTNGQLAAPGSWELSVTPATAASLKSVRVVGIKSGASPAA